MTDTPRPRSNAISPVVFMGSGGPDTSPEEVERYNPIAVAPHDIDPYGAMETDPAGGFVQHEDYAALSAELEAEKRHKLAITGDKINAVSELRQVKAERDALRAELAEAVTLLKDMRDHGANDYVIDRVLAFLARHQKGADT